MNKKENLKVIAQYMHSEVARMACVREDRLMENYLRGTSHPGYFSTVCLFYPTTLGASTLMQPIICKLTFYPV
ncbi:MAG: hypothetical protein P9L92_18895 [Candidatus Electryonea clarkiae]|nr:hypothetical protein [Candidatus Electryonea clarkiae]MDP8285697.1 hypothetical protein [Candidatus Electryonea clarkiae]